MKKIMLAISLVCTVMCPFCQEINLISGEIRQYDRLDNFLSTVDAGGNSYICGYTPVRIIKPLDLDPGTGELFFKGPGIFVQKNDANGKFVWARIIDGPITCHALYADSDGSLWITGLAADSLDMDPGLNKSSTSKEGLIGMYCQQFSGDGNVTSFLFINTVSQSKRESNSPLIKSTAIVTSPTSLYITGT